MANLVLILFFAGSILFLLKRIVHLNTKFYLIQFLLIYVFYFGLFEYFGVPSLLLKIIIDGFFLVLLTIYFARYEKYTPGFTLFILLTLIVVFSTVLNESNLYHSFTYYRTFLYPYLLFVFVFNSTLPEKKWKELNHFLTVLFIIQIFASLYKFVFLGITEKGLIGTITTSGGVYSTILPLFAISFLISSFLFYERRRRYIYLIIAFLFMGFVGAKRGIWLYFPMILISSLYFFQRITQIPVFSRRLVFVGLTILIVGFGAVYLGGKYNRSLNPENRIGGSFDLEYISNFAIEYSFHESEYGEISYGRAANFISVLEYMYKSPVMNILFGFGPDAAKGTSTYGEGIWGEMRIAGPVTGLTLLLVQLGLAGVFIILTTFYFIGRFFYTLTKTIMIPYWKSFAFAGFLIIILFFFDFLTYSSSIISTIFPLSFTLFYILGVLLRNKNVLINLHNLQES